MDMSSISTEELRHELRLRQAQILAPSKRRHSEDQSIVKVQDHSDDDPLFVSERRAECIHKNALQSTEGSTQRENHQLQSATERKRRRAQSPEVRISVPRTERNSHFPAMQQQRLDVELVRWRDSETDAPCFQITTQQEEEDRQLAERLQAEEDLLFAETQLPGHPSATQTSNSNAYRSATGSRVDPVDLHPITPFSASPHVARNRAFKIRAVKRTLRLSPYQNERDDAALALQLHDEERQAQEERTRQAALQTQDCAVCGDNKLYIELPSLSSCSHRPEACDDCYASWIASQLEANGWQEVKCPGTSCKANLTYEEIKAFAGKDVFERYDSFQARSALASDPNFRWCRAEGCLSGQIHDVEEVGNIFTCVECHARFCTVHEGAYHDNETCQAYEYRTSGQKERDERKKEEEASEKAVEKLTKKCPRETCQSPIEKNGGCNHMTCWKCQHQFCFVCLGGNWNRCGHA
ncbi:hypothetical protein EKO04_003043 [Ascochyta lentis]|uniref:RBR-type E3 ubiquitin transferase n=1 Tax=Ascochyta lentis TaxID=205686 RepID=A0A8H7JBI8_9PLEO|nr:hypothetical protein EKO04_003043 [Ascochyta lentis]